MNLMSSLFTESISDLILSSLSESASKFRVDTGPLMKASDWIPSSKLNKMIQKLVDEKETGNIAIGQLTSFSTGKSKQVAILIHDGKPDHYFKKGMNKEHSFYYDTGRGYRQTTDTITITGVVTITSDGSIKTTGKVDMNGRTSLMVFK